MSLTKKPVAFHLHATLVLHTTHRASPANTIFVAFAVKSQAEGFIVSADPAVPAAESDQWLVFEVTDTGCGISQRGLASLFTEYVQVSVHTLSLVQRCCPWCCIQRNASPFILAFVSFCSIACALLLCQQLSAATVPFSIGISTGQSCIFTCHADCLHV